MFLLNQVPVTGEYSSGSMLCGTHQHWLPPLWLDPDSWRRLWAQIAPASVWLLPGDLCVHTRMIPNVMNTWYTEFNIFWLSSGPYFYLFCGSGHLPLVSRCSGAQGGSGSGIFLFFFFSVIRN